MLFKTKKAESSVGTAVAVTISIILAGLVLLGVVSLVDNIVAPAVANTVTEQQAVVVRDETVIVQSYVIGDVNKDGKIDNKDLIYLKGYLDGEYTEINKSLADVNSDGKISADDYNTLKQTIERNGTEFNKGDLDKNGTVDENDKLYLDRYTAGWAGYDTLDVDVADMNGDGVVNGSDIESLKTLLGE